MLQDNCNKGERYNDWSMKRVFVGAQSWNTQPSLGERRCQGRFPIRDGPKMRLIYELG